MPDLIDRLVSSPACIPQWELAPLLEAYRRLGFSRFEAFTHWCQSHMDWRRPAQQYLDVARPLGMAYTSLHLPVVKKDAPDATLADAVAAARFAAALGAGVVLFKAEDRPTYIDAGRRFLDAIDDAGIAVTPVLQNHKGTPITTLDDFGEVIDGIGDRRMKALLEVGHFARIGVDWRQGYDLLGPSIALVHVNDIRDGQSVPYGTGEVDFAGLLRQLRRDAYAGHIVVELELDTRQTDPDRTLRELAAAIEHLRRCGAEA